MIQRPVRHAILTASFVLFLCPLTIGEFSANYGFTLLPLAVIVMTRRVKRPASVVYLAMGVFTILFLMACVTQLDEVALIWRRAVSFALFMAIFAYALIPVDDDMVHAFKAALVTISAGMATYTLIDFFLSGGAALGASAKNVVGGQRFAFVQLMGFWVCLLAKPRRSAIAAARWGVVAVISAGLLLTFTRAAVVALVGSLALYATGYMRLRRVTWRNLRSGAVTLVLVGAIGLGVVALLPTAAEYFQTRFFGLLENPKELHKALTDPIYSEGTRLFLLKVGTEYVLYHPVAGSGYLGIWILPQATQGRGAFAVGSAHDQYLDVLFRTGLIGFGAYVLLLIFTMSEMRRVQPSLYWGLWGVVIYGLFQETFKEAHGAFLIAFCLGAASTQIRRRAAVVEASEMGSCIP